MDERNRKPDKGSNDTRHLHLEEVHAETKVNWGSELVGGHG